MEKLLVLVVLVVILIIITLVLIANTYAKYTTELTKVGMVQVAKWSFKANGSDTVLKNVFLEDTTLNSKVTNNYIAPGTDGGLSIKLDARESEVAINYIVELSNIRNKPTNLNFYLDSEYTTELTPENGKYIISNTISLAEVNTPIDVPIYWKWEYETGKTETEIQDGDMLDTTFGKATEDMTFNVAITGIQQNSVV